MRLVNLSKNAEENQKLEHFINKLENGDKDFEFKTSGSTGKPKSIFFKRNQLEISANQTIDFFGLTVDDVLLCPFSMDYVAAKMMVARAFFLNATLVFTGPTGNPFLLSDLPNVSFAALVPLQLNKVIENEDSLCQLNRVKNVIIGGAPVSQNLEDRIRDLIECKIYQTYGMTETLTHVAVRNLKEKSANYFALNGVKLQVNQNSCLRIKSPVNNQWLQTNDVVALNKNGFEWKGRFDNVINSGAFKISIDSVESSLYGLGFENQLFICGIESELLGEECAIVTVSDIKDEIVKKIDLAQLHPYEKPKKIVFVNEFPINQNGKIMRSELKNLALQSVRNGRYQDLV